MEHTHSYSVKITRNKEKNEVIIEGELSADEFKTFVKRETVALVKEAELPGFRRGAAPEKLVVEKIGMEAILFRAAEDALDHIYPHILEDEKIDAIGRPKVSITKLAKDNPLGFNITLEVIPEIHFDYKSIAKTENKKEVLPEEVKDTDVDNVVKELKGAYLKRKDPKKIPEPKELEELALTDEIVKTFGDFKSVEDFKTKVRENLGKEKEYRAKEKKRIGLLSALVKASGLKVPEVLIEAEAERFLREFKHDVTRMGITWEDYMKHTKKSEEEMKKEWRKDSEEKAALELILDNIAKKESVIPDEKKVEEEVSHLLSHHKDIPLENAKSYIRHMLTKSAVIEFLEKQ